MKTNLKTVLAAGVLAAGAVATASAAQQPSQSRQQQTAPMTGQMPMQQAPMMAHEHPMTGNPQARAHMSGMMRGCQRMMQHMGDMREHRGQGH